MTTEDANPRPDEQAAEPLALRLNDLLGRLEAHACMHDDLVVHDAEQAQWAADLREARAEIERLRALHRKVYGLACDGTIGVLDPHKTCGGGVFTLWDELKLAADGVA